MFVQKTAHQIGGKHIIGQQFGGVFDGVEQENAQIGGLALNQVDVVTKAHFQTGSIDGSGRVGFAAVIQRYGDVAHCLLHVIEIPFLQSGPRLGEVFDDHGFAWL